MQNEIWKDIKGYEGLYQISNFGNVKSLARRLNCAGNGTRLMRERIMKGRVTPYGYLQVNLINNKKSKTYRVSRLVAEAFIPNPNNLPEVNHIDEDKTNNNVDNLEWCTRKYNMNYGIGAERRQEANIRNRKPVLQYSLDGELIAEHESLMAAGRATGFNVSNIYSCCTGKYKKAYGFIFTFSNEELILD